MRQWMIILCTSLMTINNLWFNFPFLFYVCISENEGGGVEARKLLTQILEIYLQPFLNHILWGILSMDGLMYPLCHLGRDIKTKEISGILNQTIKYFVEFKVYKNYKIYIPRYKKMALKAEVHI